RVHAAGRLVVPDASADPCGGCEQSFAPVPTDCRNSGHWSVSHLGLPGPIAPAGCFRSLFPSLFDEPAVTHFAGSVGGPLSSGGRGALQLLQHVHVIKSPFRVVDHSFSVSVTVFPKLRPLLRPL